MSVQFVISKLVISKLVISKRWRYAASRLVHDRCAWSSAPPTFPDAASAVDEEFLALAIHQLHPQPIP